MNNIMKFATFFAAATFAASVVRGAPPDNAESLAATIRPMLPPSGWKMSAKGDTVILERDEKIGWYNGLQLPYFESEEELRAYVKPHVHYEKLAVSLRLGKRIDAEAFDAMEKTNANAVKLARRDAHNPTFMPRGEFWAKNPQYGYQEPPIIDAGTHSIYMDCHPPGAILRPTNDKRTGGRIVNYWDKAIGRECQGIVDDLGKAFSTY